MEKMTKRVEPRKNLRPLQYSDDIARDFLYGKAQYSLMENIQWERQEDCQN